jgi:hypothetical protein
MNKAHTAMYEGKQGGRNNYRFYQPEMRARLADCQFLEKDLR